MALTVSDNPEYKIVAADDVVIGEAWDDGAALQLMKQRGGRGATTVNRKGEIVWGPQRTGQLPGPASKWVWHYLPELGIFLAADEIYRPVAPQDGPVVVADNLGRELVRYDHAEGRIPRLIEEEARLTAEYYATEDEEHNRRILIHRESFGTFIARTRCPCCGHDASLHAPEGVCLTCGCGRQGPSYYRTWKR